MVRLGWSKVAITHCELACYYRTRRNLPDICKIAEDERLLQIEAHSDDISCVPERKIVRLFRFQFMLEQEFLVVWQEYVQPSRHRVI